MRYNTVIFDLDGTLLDTLDDLYLSTNYAMEQVGEPLLTRDQVRRYVGNGLDNLIARALQGGRENPHFDEALATLRSYYNAHSKVNTAPYPGVMELIRDIKAMGMAVAVVSNKPDVEVKPLIEDYFNGEIPVAIGQQEGIERKPAPDMVYEALRILGRDRSEAVYIGDSEVDVATGRNAGMDCITVTWGFRDRDVLDAAGAAMYADTTAEVLQWLRGEC